MMIRMRALRAPSSRGPPGSQWLPRVAHDLKGPTQLVDDRLPVRSQSVPDTRHAAGAHPGQAWREDESDGVEVCPGITHTDRAGIEPSDEGQRLALDGHLDRRRPALESRNGAGAAHRGDGAGGRTDGESSRG